MLANVAAHFVPVQCSRTYRTKSVLYEPLCKWFSSVENNIRFFGGFQIVILFVVLILKYLWYKNTGLFYSSQNFSEEVFT